MQQFLVCTGMSGRYQNKGQHLFTESVVTIQLSHGIDKDIDSFVFKLVPSTDTQDQGVFGYGTPQNRLCHLKKFFSSGLSFAFPFGFGRRKDILKSIGSNQVYFFIQKMSTFGSRDLTDRSETIGLMCCGLLERLFGNDIETTCQFFGYIIFHLTVRG